MSEYSLYIIGLRVRMTGDCRRNAKSVGAVVAHGDDGKNTPILPPLPIPSVQHCMSDSYQGYSRSISPFSGAGLGWASAAGLVDETLAWSIAESFPGLRFVI